MASHTSFFLQNEGLELRLRAPSWPKLLGRQASDVIGGHGWGKGARKAFEGRGRLDLREAHVRTRSEIEHALGQKAKAAARRRSVDGGLGGFHLVEKTAGVLKPAREFLHGVDAPLRGAHGVFGDGHGACHRVGMRIG